MNQETANAIVMQLSTATGLITQGRSLGFRALATKSAMEDLHTLIFKELSTP